MFFVSLGWGTRRGFSKTPLKPYHFNCTWEVPNLLVLNLVVCNFYTNVLFGALMRPFALFCALLRTCVCALLRVFALFCAYLRSFAIICVFLRPTAFRTTAFGNCRLTLGAQTFPEVSAKKTSQAIRQARSQARSQPRGEAKPGSQESQTRSYVKVEANK